MAKTPEDRLTILETQFSTELRHLATKADLYRTIGFAVGVVVASMAANREVPVETSTEVKGLQMATPSVDVQVGELRRQTRRRGQATLTT